MGYIFAMILFFAWENSAADSTPRSRNASRAAISAAMLMLPPPPAAAPAPAPDPAPDPDPVAVASATTKKVEAGVVMGAGEAREETGGRLCR